MSKTRIFSVVGARPQFVKAAIVSQALEKYPDVEHAIVHTGQHYDQNMSDVFFEELGMPAPAFNLHFSASGHCAMTGRMLEALEKDSAEPPMEALPDKEMLEELYPEEIDAAGPFSAPSSLPRFALPLSS